MIASRFCSMPPRERLPAAGTLRPSRSGVESRCRRGMSAA
jgi:hypothetical protein